MLLSITLTLAASDASASPFATLAELPPDYYQPAFQLHEIVPSYALNQKIRYYEDRSGILSIDEVMTDEFSKHMSKKEQGIISLGFTDSAVWIKLPVRYRGEKEKATFWFELQMALADHVQFFIVTEDNRIFTHYAGYETGMEARDMIYGAPVFPFTIRKNETLTLYARVKSHSSMRIPVSIHSNKGLITHISNTEFIYAAVFGAIFIMIVYNLFLYLTIREKSHGFYILFLCTYFLAFAVERVHGLYFLGSDVQSLMSRSLLISFTWLTYITGIAMARAFIDTKKLWPTFDYLIRISMYASISSALLGNFLPTTTAYPWAVNGAVFNTGLLLFMGLYAVYKRVNGGFIFLVSWIVNFGGLMGYALAMGGKIPFNIITWNATLAGVLIQTALLSFALGDRIKAAQQKAIDANEQLLMHLEKYKKLFNNAVEGVFQLNPKRRVIEANPAFVKMLGFMSLENLKRLKSDMVDLCFVVNKDKQQIISRIETHQDIWQFEAQYVTCQGQKRWAATSMRWVTSPDDPNKTYIEGSFVDITDQIEKEEAEKQRYKDRLQKFAAESSAMAKSQFLANMSHEIRTPLTAIIGYGESLQDDSLTQEEKAKSIETIVRSGHHLLELINDILDQTSIDENKLEIAIQHVSFLDLMEEVKSYFEPKSQEKALVFIINYHFPLPEKINTDPTRLKQILINLCSNALKFTEKGSIQIDVSCDKEKEKIFIKVKDTGIGLKPDQISRLFTAYQQADSSTAREYGGTGLGLNISKKLAELLGGTIRVSSIYGEGSEFEVSIASGLLTSTKFIKDGSELGKAQKLVHIGNAPKLKGSILYAEDNDINRRLISMLVKKTGADIVMVENGAEAVKAALKDSFDLILMDIQMPIMNGVDATEAIRQAGNKTPIVALTANIMAQDIQEYLAAGCEDCLEKPVDKKKFYATLSHYLLAANEVEKLPLFNGTILVADDHLDNQLLMKRYLNKVGLQTIIAENGKQAVELATNENVDMILMDLHMPEMSGEEAIKVLRERNITKPVYAFTASEFEEDLVRLEQAGCEGILNKPVNRRELYDVFKKHLPIIDTAEVKTEHIDNNALKPIHAQFLLELPTKLEQLAKNIHDKQWAIVRETAHKLSGISGLLGYKALEYGCRQLNTHIKANNDAGYEEWSKKVIKEIKNIIKATVKQEQNG